MSAASITLPGSTTIERLTALPDQTATLQGRFKQTYLRSLLRRGVLAGLIEAEEEEWMLKLAAEGANLQADVSDLNDKTYLKNYNSAERDRGPVTSALLKRVQ